MKKWYRSTLAIILSGIMMIPSGISVLAGNGNTGDNSVIYNTENVTEYPRTAFVADDRPVERIYETAQADNIVQAAGLESKYIPAGIMTSSFPAVRDQNPYGTCWAFAPTALAELSVLHKENKMVDLSELHTAYFAYHYSSDDGKDGVNYSSTTSYLDRGGDPSFAYHAYANWVGVADETMVSYSSASATINNGLPNALAMKDSVHLRNFYVVNKNDKEYIKTLIKEYGGVGMSYYDADQYYTASTNSYYSGKSYSSNHAISVVGWDDNKVTRSSGKGAWLVRNSWGENSYSHYGYFWMSYDEPSIYRSVYALDCVSDTGSSNDEYYDHNYQYDLSAYSQYGWSGDFENYVRTANVYTATGNQLLKAVGIETQNTNLDYTVKIYTDMTDSSNPESGTLMRTQTGSLTYQGFNTIVLKNPLLLTNGKKFSVVIRLESQDGVTMPSYVMESNYTLTDGATWYCGAEKGQSFVYSNGWQDVGESSGANLRIKAYTDDTELVKPSASSTVMVSNTTASLTVRWSAGAYATSYDVYRSENGGSYSKIATVASTNYLDTNVKYDNTYSYKIKSVNIKGTSGYSPSCSMEKTRLYVKGYTARCDGQLMELSWSANPTAEEDGYIIYRRREDEASFKEIARTSDTSYVDNDIFMGRKYYYTVALYAGDRKEDSTYVLGLYCLTPPLEMGVSNIVGGLRIEWKEVQNATGYEIYRSKSKGEYSLLGMIDAETDPHFNDLTTENGYTYSYMVRAVTVGGKSMYSQSVSLKKSALQVTNFTAKGSTSSVGLQWKKAAGAEGYIIYRRTENGSYTRIASTTATSYTVNNVAAGTAYYYTVAPYYEDRTESKCTGIKVTCLKAPALTGASNTTAGVQVKWSKVTGATGYIVYRKSGSGSFARIADIKSGTTVSYTDKTAAGGKTYTYTVRAYNANATSIWNSTKSVRRLVNPAVTGASNTTAGVQVKWSKVTGAAGYIVYRKTGSGSFARIADIKSGTTVSYTDKTAASGTTYTYTVRAYNGNTMSAWNSTKTVKRLSDPKLTSASKVTGGINVKWNKVTGATGYIVYRKTAVSGWSRVADIKSGSTTSYTDKTAKTGTRYTYTVRAYSGSTMGDWSSVKVITR